MNPDAPDDDGEVERTTHSFVLRLWREEGAVRGGQPFWRGTITHLPGSERQTVQQLSEIIAFVVPYLEQLGLRVAIGWRLQRWALRRRRPSRH